MCAFASAVPCDLLALLLQPACLPAYAAGKRLASRPAPCSVLWKAKDTPKPSTRPLLLAAELPVHAAL